LYAVAASAISATPDPTKLADDPQFVPAGQSLILLTLTGNRAATVSLLDISTEIVGRKPPRAGTLVGIPPQGEQGNIKVTLGLDAPVPTVTDVASREPFFAGHHVDLRRGEIQELRIVAFTTTCECSWRLHLHAMRRGHSQELVAPPPGEPPYAMTAFLPRPDDYAFQYLWIDGVEDLAAHDCAAEREACAAALLPTTAPSPR
jgi:hypothetical protein